MEYRVDREMLREGPVDDDNLRFETSSQADALEPALAG
jgi:hypothetical protein